VAAQQTVLALLLDGPRFPAGRAAHALVRPRRNEIGSTMPAWPRHRRCDALTSLDPLGHGASSAAFATAQPLG
jgi:hypothetical protein